MLRMLLIAMLSGLAVCAAQDVTQDAGLTRRVKAMAAEHHGDVAVFAENLRTHETVAIAADVPVQTASVIKLTILYEAMEQVRAGKVHWNDLIVMKKTDQVPGSGVMLFFDAPITLTLKDVLTMMIVMSDNSASNLAMDALGIENVNKRIAGMGLKDTYLYKKIFTPVAAGVTMPADQKKFGLGKTTAREMAAVMTKIAACDLGGQPTAGDGAICGVALKMLHLQFYRSSIPRYLDGMKGATGDSIANKTGSLDAVRADVAAVSTKAGMVVISCFTYNNRDRSWGVEHEGEMTIAKMAREIVTAWSPDGLAPWPVAGVAMIAPAKR